MLVSSDRVPALVAQPMSKVCEAADNPVNRPWIAIVNDALAVGSVVRPSDVQAPASTRIYSVALAPALEHCSVPRQSTRICDPAKPVVNNCESIATGDAEVVLLDPLFCATTVWVTA